MKNFFLLLFLLPSLHKLHAQGCSDAGFCTINSFKTNTPDTLTENYKNQFETGIAYGKGDHNITIVNPYMEYTRIFTPKWSLNTRLLFLSARGALATTSGFSDIFISSSYTASAKIKLTAGVKIPLNDGNNMLDGLPLPMGYQTSLGTTDLIGGVSYLLNRLGISIAIQQPVTQNKNQFDPQLYPPATEAVNHQPTNNYTRKGDALVRVNYAFNKNEKLKITPGLLFIYHLGNDTYLDATGEERSISGSEGLTLNGILAAEYTLNSKNRIELSVGAPFVARTSRPDGLTRRYVASIEYKVAF